MLILNSNACESQWKFIYILMPRLEQVPHSKFGKEGEGFLSHILPTELRALMNS